MRLAPDIRVAHVIKQSLIKWYTLLNEEHTNLETQQLTTWAFISFY